jgi:hypothetical protein
MRHSSGIFLSNRSSGSTLFILVRAKLKLIFLSALWEISVGFWNRRTLSDISLQHVDMTSSVLEKIDNLIDFFAVWRLLHLYPVDQLIVNLFFVDADDFSLSKEGLKVKISGSPLTRLLNNKVIDNFTVFLFLDSAISSSC